MLVLIGTAASCTIVSEDDTLADVLVPLEVGNTWTYTMSQERRTSGTVTYVVVDEVVFDGIPHAEIVVTTRLHATGEASENTIYAFNRIDGLWMGMTAQGERLSGGDFFKYPAETGDHYSISGEDVCVQQADGSRVPAGTFDVFSYGACADFQDHLYRFAPNVGMTFSGNFDRTALHLASYDLLAP